MPAPDPERREQPLRPGGAFIVTCATEPREPHAADGSGAPHEGEHYHNVGRGMMQDVLESAGFSVVLMEHLSPPGDLYALALKAR